MKNLLLASLALAFIIGFFYFLNKSNPSNQSYLDLGNTIDNLSQQMPKDWVKSDKLDNNTVIKYQKEVTGGFVPQVVYSQITVNILETPEKYFSKLISGLKSTIPGFILNNTSDITQDEYFAKKIIGSYRYKQDTIQIVQHIYIKDNTVGTITASYTNKSADITEINSVVENIAKSKISF